MPKKSSIVVSIVMLWAASLACGQSVNVPTVDPNAASTAIAETIVALEAQFTPTFTPVASSPTAEASTATPDTSLTPEATEAAGLPAVYVTVSVDTFCRLGTGKEYEKVGILLVGETAEVVGREAFGQFWYIRNPDVGPEYCWISAEYATVEGNVLSLFAQPPPSNLSSDVDFGYGGLGKCRDRWWVNVQIRNRSSSTFKSISLIVIDGTINVSRSMSVNGFPFTDRCASPTSVGTLDPDSTVTISSPEYPYNIVGEEMTVSVTLCTDVNLQGTCVADKLAFTP
jgi:hypothetical protein